MTSLALIHGMLVERKNGALRKTNLFLAVFTFLLVVYGTFSDKVGCSGRFFGFTVFVDLGVNVYLIGFMLGMALLSLVVFFARAGRITGPSLNLAATVSGIRPAGIGLVASADCPRRPFRYLLAAHNHVDRESRDGRYGSLYPGIDASGNRHRPLPGFCPFMLGTGGRAADLVKKSYPLGGGIAGRRSHRFRRRREGRDPFAFHIFCRPGVFLQYPGPGAISAETACLRRRPGDSFWIRLMLIGILGSSAYAVNQKNRHRPGWDKDRIWGRYFLSGYAGGSRIS